MARLALPLACLAVGAGCGGDEDVPPAATTTTTTATTRSEPAEATGERRAFEGRMRDALRAQGLADEVDVDCVIDELRGSLSNRTVSAASEAIEAGEDVPQRAVDAAFEAGERCRRSN